MRSWIAVAVALVVGFFIGSVLAGHRNEKEMTLRGHWARSLFRVAERHVGHERLIVEWREEAQRPESTLVAVPEIDARASH